MSHQFVFSSNKTSWTTNLEKSIHVDNDQNPYEIALLNLETYNSIPNIDETNNKFVYTLPNESHLLALGEGGHEIIFPTGSYDITDINNFILKTLKIGHWDEQTEEYPITLTANNSTLKCELQIRDGYIMDFTHDLSVANLLGFDKKIYTVAGFMNLNILLI